MGPVDPVQRLARVFRQDGSETLLAESGSLDGEDVRRDPLGGHALSLGATPSRMRQWMGVSRLA